MTGRREANVRLTADQLEKVMHAVERVISEDWEYPDDDLIDARYRLLAAWQETGR